MTTGQKIARLRNKKKMTQEDLADKMNVSRQTIYKWENDIVFPTKDNLTDLVSILETNYDYLLSPDSNMDDSPRKDSTNVSNETNANPIDTTNSTPTSTTSESQVNTAAPINNANSINETPNNVTIIQSQVPLYTCSRCNKLIYKENDAKTYTEITHTGRRRRGHHRHKKTTTVTVCKECYAKRQKEKEEQALRLAEAQKYATKKKLIKNFVFAGLAALCVLILGIAGAILAPEYQTLYIWIATLGTIITYTFTGCMILFNNIVVSIFLTVASWGFVKMPGIIFGSVGDLIVAKIALTILSFFLAAFAVVCAFFISALISIFVYPYAIYKAINYPDRTWEFE